MHGDKRLFENAKKVYPRREGACMEIAGLKAGLQVWRWKENRLFVELTFAIFLVN